MMKVHVAVGFAFIALTTTALPAHATNANGDLDLTLDGVDSGFVRSTTNANADGPKKTITISSLEPTRPLVNAVRGFLEGSSSGKTAKKSSIVLSTGAVIQKANDARLVDVRLPSYAGNANDLLLTFEAASTSKSPSLRAVSDRAKPTGTRLAGFRLNLGDLPLTEATRLDSLSVKNKEGGAIPGTFAFDVPSKDAPTFLAWAKKPKTRDGSIEYISATGELILSVKLATCTASSATIDGPVTHVTVTCAHAR